MLASAANSIFVQLDTYEVVPGDKLSGIAYAHIYNGKNSGKIYVGIKGAEETKDCEAESMTLTGYNLYMASRCSMKKWRYSPLEWSVEWRSWHELPITQHYRSEDKENNQSEQPEMRRVYKHYYEYYEQVDTDILIYDHGGPLAPGLYSFYFKIQIPSRIPASIEYEWTSLSNRCFGSIFYFVTAHISSNSAYYESGITVKIPITVNNAPNRAQGVNIAAQLEEHATACCCWPLGMITQRSYFEKDNYRPGEDAYMISEVDATNLKVGVATISAVIKKFYISSCKGHVTTFNRTPSTVSLSGVEKGKMLVGPNAVRHKLQIPSDLDPTTIGRLVRNYYTLSSVSNLDGMFVNQKPEISLNLNLYNALPRRETWMPPSNWNPTVLLSPGSGGVSEGMNDPQGPPMFPSEPTNNAPYMPQSQTTNESAKGDYMQAP